MQHYYDVVLSSNIRPIVGASVTVYQAGTNVKATLYGDSGGTPKANPLTTSAAGVFEFYVVDGYYDLEVTGPGLTTTRQRDIAISSGGADVVADLAQTVPCAVTMAFDLAQGNVIRVTLDRNVSASTFTGAVSPTRKVTFALTQDAIGGRTFAWPTNIVGGMAISETPNSVNVQEGLWVGGVLYMTPGSFSA